MKTLLTLTLFLSSFSLLGQDSLRIMYYNLLKFPATNASRTDEYRTIFQYYQPDVLAVNELDSEIGADLILDSSLNVYGTTTYQRAAFVDGIDTDNCLFYNADKLGLVSQLQLQTVLRDISVYRMYYKAPNLTAQTDTIYCWFFCCHLKAGVADYEQRNQEAQQIKFYLNDIAGSTENVFVGGDFNFYSGFESGCQTLLNSGSTPLIDPANAIGNWSGDWSYAQWHTQSTRTGSVNGGSGGGLDDRFDLIFVSEDVMNNENGVSYLNGTYQPLGQDGNHYNQSVNVGTNNSAPDSVIQALYWGSDHLPITMQIVFDETAQMGENEALYIQVFQDHMNNSLKVLSPFDAFDIELYDLSGRLVLSDYECDGNITLKSGLSGIYVWRIMSENNRFSGKVFLKSI